MSLQRTLNLIVRNQDREPVSGAYVTATNNYGGIVVSGTTGSEGVVSGVVTYRWEVNTSGDSLNFNPFILKAKKGADSTVV